MVKILKREFDFRTVFVAAAFLAFLFVLILPILFSGKCINNSMTTGKNESDIGQQISPTVNPFVMNQSTLPPNNTNSWTTPQTNAEGGLNNLQQSAEVSNMSNIKNQDNAVKDNSTTSLKEHLATYKSNRVNLTDQIFDDKMVKLNKTENNQTRINGTLKLAIDELNRNTTENNFGIEISGLLNTADTNRTKPTKLTFGKDEHDIENSELPPIGSANRTLLMIPPFFGFRNRPPVQHAPRKRTAQTLDSGFQKKKN